MADDPAQGYIDSLPATNNQPGNADPFANIKPAIPEAESDTPAWGQSLGQDVQNVGRVTGNAIRKPLQAASDTLYGAGQAAGEGIGNIAPRIMSYLSGHGAMDQDQWDRLGSTVDPQGTMDQNERTMRSIDTAAQHDPELGSAALQHARKQYDIYKANAAKELALGNLPLAAQEATQAHNYIPDGVKTVFAATKDGFTVGVWTPDGQQQKYNLSPAQMSAMLRGEHGLFDHVTTHTSPKIIQAAQEAGAQAQPGAQGTTNQTPFGQNPATNQGPADLNVGAEGAGGKPPQAPPTSFPGNVPGPQGTAGAIPGKTPGRSLATGDRGPTYEDAGTHEGGRTSLDNASDRRQAYIAAAERANRQTRSNVAQYVAQALGRPVASNTQDIIEQQHENQLESQRVAGEGATQRARIIAEGRNANARERANATVQSALIRAQALASGNDHRFDAEQTRSATQILTSITKNGGTLEDAIKQMQGKVHPDLIQHLTGQGGEQQAPQGGNQQYNTQAPRDPQARVKGMIYVTPAMGPMKWTGTGWVKP